MGIQAWQAGQGYNLYGDGIIGPHSSEATTIGRDFFGASNQKTLMQVAQQETKLTNFWDGGYNVARKGDIIMNYGPLSAADLGYVHSDWQALAKAGKPDMNYSKFPSVMADTYVNPNTGAKLTELLNPNFTGTVEGVKRAHTGFAFLPEGTKVLSSEAQMAGVAATTVKPFQAVAMDAAGCYLTPGKTLGKYVATDAAGMVESGLLKEYLAKSKGLAPEAQSKLYAEFLDVSKKATDALKGTPHAEKATRIMQQAVRYVEEGANPELAQNASRRLSKIMMSHATAPVATSVTAPAANAANVANVAEKGSSFLGKAKQFFSSNGGKITLALAGVAVAIGAYVYFTKDKSAPEMA